MVAQDPVADAAVGYRGPVIDMVGAPAGGLRPSVEHGQFDPVAAVPADHRRSAVSRPEHRFDVSRAKLPRPERVALRPLNKRAVRRLVRLVGVRMAGGVLGARIALPEGGYPLRREQTSERPCRRNGQGRTRHKCVAAHVEQHRVILRPGERVARHWVRHGGNPVRGVQVHVEVRVRRLLVLAVRGRQHPVRRDNLAGAPVRVPVTSLSASLVQERRA